MKNTSELKVEQQNVKTNLYTPVTVGATTDASVAKTLSFANAGLSLGRTKSNIAQLIALNNKDIHHPEFSLYLHDSISQINIGDASEFLAAPNGEKTVLTANDKNTWDLTVSELKAGNASVLKAAASLTAHLDTTSKYIYVPHISADATAGTVKITFNCFCSHLISSCSPNIFT